MYNYKIKNMKKLIVIIAGLLWIMGIRAQEVKVEYEGLENSFSIPDCPVNVIFQAPEKYTASVGGAETFDELFARTGTFLREVIDPLMKEGKDVLIVGHGVMNLSIISQVRNLPRKDFWSTGIENCKMIRLL